MSSKNHDILGARAHESVTPGPAGTRQGAKNTGINKGCLGQPDMSGFRQMVLQYSTLVTKHRLFSSLSYKPLKCTHKVKKGEPKRNIFYLLSLYFSYFSLPGIIPLSIFHKHKNMTTN